MSKDPPLCFSAPQAKFLFGVCFSAVVYLVNLSALLSLTGSERVCHSHWLIHYPWNQWPRGSLAVFVLAPLPLQRGTRNVRQRCMCLLDSLSSPLQGLNCLVDPVIKQPTLLFDLVMLCVLPLYLLSYFRDLPRAPVLKYHCDCCYLAMGPCLGQFSNIQFEICWKFYTGNGLFRSTKLPLTCFAHFSCNRCRETQFKFLPLI